MTDLDTIKAINEVAIPIDVEKMDIEKVLNLIGEKHIVLIGEASHGTHEFYERRAKITQALIQQKGFNAVAIEGDWPDAYQVNRYLHGASDVTSANEALKGFRRFPTWMWRNTVVASFIDWLRKHNDQNSEWTKKVGFYGLDLYSIHASIEAVIQYLEKMDPEAAKAAKIRYDCFDLNHREPEEYARSAVMDVKNSCESVVKEQLMELQRKAFEYVKNDGLFAKDEFFYAEQNARLVKDAEAYYRSLFISDESSWNTRDRHMAETLEVLERHLSKQLNKNAKIVVWAHNSHIGDAQATDMGKHRGELNIGQLARERFKDESFLLGFSTYEGTVTATTNWGSHAERKIVRPALKESYEELFHEVKYKNFLLDFSLENKAKELLCKPRLERFIGVIYRPETERLSHYYHADITKQFDALIYLDKTKAITGLEINSEWEKGELLDTYPFGI